MFLPVPVIPRVFVYMCVLPSPQMVVSSILPVPYLSLFHQHARQLARLNQLIVMWFLNYLCHRINSNVIDSITISEKNKNRIWLLYEAIHKWKSCFTIAHDPRMSATSSPTSSQPHSSHWLSHFSPQMRHIRKNDRAKSSVALQCPHTRVYVCLCPSVRSCMCLIIKIIFLLFPIHCGKILASYCFVYSPIIHLRRIVVAEPVCPSVSSYGYAYLIVLVYVHVFGFCQ